MTLKQARIKAFRDVKVTADEVRIVESGQVSLDTCTFMSGLDEDELRRLVAYRRAVQAGFFNEG